MQFTLYFRKAIAVSEIVCFKIYEYIKIIDFD